MFYPRYIAESVAKYVPLILYAWRVNRLRRRIENDPESAAYTDVALTPVADAAEEHLDMFELNDSSRAAVDKARKEAKARAKHEVKKRAELKADGEVPSAPTRDPLHTIGPRP